MTDFTVQLRIAEKDEIKTIRDEAIRYMGYSGSNPDEATNTLINVCEKELLQVINGRACYAFSGVSFTKENVVDIGFGDIYSKSLYKHLQGCHSVILFAATIGIGADRLITKYGRLSPAKSVIIDALASSAIEYWCDVVELELTKNEKSCSRFSAGYGDFPLEHQKDFARCLDVSRKLGITLSDSLLMTPTKSVTAVIGLGGTARTCGNRCMSCTNKHCIYRE